MDPHVGYNNYNIKQQLHMLGQSLLQSQANTLCKILSMYSQFIQIARSTPCYIEGKAAEFMPDLESIAFNTMQYKVDAIGVET